MARLALTLVSVLILGACAWLSSITIQNLQSTPDCWACTPSPHIMTTRNSQTISPYPAVEMPQDSPLPSPESTCSTHSASLELFPSTTDLQVGEKLTLTMTLINDGCANIGLPRYSLLIAEDPPALLELSGLESQIHYLGLSPGQSDQAIFIIMTEQSGRIDLTANTSFEVHLGYPGPAYWATASSERITIKVRP